MQNKETMKLFLPVNIYVVNITNSTKKKKKEVSEVHKEKKDEFLVFTCLRFMPRNLQNGYA